MEILVIGHNGPYQARLNTSLKVIECWRFVQELLNEGVRISGTILLEWASTCEIDLVTVGIEQLEYLVEQYGEPKVTYSYPEALVVQLMKLHTLMNDAYLTGMCDGGFAQINHDEELLEIINSIHDDGITQERNRIITGLGGILPLGMDLD